jgi:hypothetical protein
MTWILLVMLSSSLGNPVALTNVPGFVSKQSCEQAGQTMMNNYSFANSGAKYVCIPQPQK